MIRFILLVLMIVAVIAITPILIDEPGYIAIAMGNNIIELTVYTAIFWLSFTAMIILLTVKLLRGGLKLSFKGWHKVAFASRRRAVKDFNKGIAAYLLEDYQQAEHLLSKSAEPAQAQQTAYLLAASAASKQQLAPNTRHYLTLVTEHSNALKSAGLEAVLVNIKLLMVQEDYAKARELIDQHHKHIGHNAFLLQLEIDLCLIEKRFDVAVDYLVSARKQKELNDLINSWEEQAFFGAFNEQIRLHDQQTLHHYWQKISRKIKQREPVLFAYCRVLAKHEILAPLEKLLLPALKKDAGSGFLKQLQSLPMGKVGNKAEQLILVVEKHLQQNMHSAKWLSCLGHLALMGGQWSLAEKSFHSLFHLEIKQYDNGDLLGCATALTEQGKYQEANALLKEILSTT